MPETIHTEAVIAHIEDVAAYIEDVATHTKYLTAHIVTAYHAWVLQEPTWRLQLPK